jgi:rSAM/selenodomain-associated transferase 1
MEPMQSVGVGIFCKTPAAGFSKTRLSPPLRPEECGMLSACFIRDLAATINGLCFEGGITPYAVYTPAGTEDRLRALLPPGFRLLLQCEGDFGTRLLRATTDLLDAGHVGAILLNADSPTLPASILRAAVSALRSDDAVVLGPAIDGGYTLIGLSRPHARVFEDIPWSTPDVYRLTVQRAAEIGVPVVTLPLWYDVDDRATLRLLESELAGEGLSFADTDVRGAPALATRRFIEQRHASLPAETSW